MIRQVDWAWIAMGAVETHRELARPAALRTDRVDRIKPVRANAGERRRTSSLSLAARASQPVPASS